MALNDVISMFADNWADCVAHCKWGTTMFFNDLDKSLDELHRAYPEDMKEIIPNKENFFGDDPKELIPKRFEKKRDKFAEIIHRLIEKHPEDEGKLKVVLEEYYVKSEKHYWSTIVMAMIAAVTGGGKALTGNAPHFTFAANQKDFTLIETLADFKRHPVYHLWEFAFSSTYATLVDPALGQMMFSQDMVKKAQLKLQEKIQASFPNFEAKKAELEAKEKAAAGKKQTMGRRAFLPVKS
jgi:hypothetical protein